MDKYRWSLEPADLAYCSKPSGRGESRVAIHPMACIPKGPFKLHSRIQTSRNGLHCVDLVECLASGRLSIDKHTLMTSSTREGREASAAALQELDLLLLVHNADNVVQMEHHLLQGERLHLVHEYCGRGDLLDMMHQELRLQTAGVSYQGSFITTLTDSGRRGIFASALRGVHALHSLGVAHMDLSLENIFVTDSGIVKIGDLGHAQRFQLDQPNLQVFQVAKEAYAAPELFTHTTVEDGRCADAWSLGVILWTLCTKRPLVHRASLDRNIFFGRMVERGTAATLHETGLLALISAPCVDLLIGLLEVNPKARLSVAAALQHPWFMPETATPKQRIRRNSLGNRIKTKRQALSMKNQHLVEKTIRSSAEIALDSTRIPLESRNLA